MASGKKGEVTLKRIFANEKYCIGCRLCEIHCQVQHSRSKNIIKAFKNERADLTPRLVVEQESYHSFALQCRHCEDAQCLEACMTGAMQRDPETGVVTSDPERCVGCWMCIMVCPYGAINRGRDRRVASKCDMCGGADEPACVANCPNEALTYEEDEEDDEE